MAKWYLYENEEVVGPYDPSDLEGRIKEETLVCRAGEKDWNRAGSVSELSNVIRSEEPKPSSSPEPSGQASTEPTGTEKDQNQTEIIEPTLENFLTICEEASDRALINELEEHYEKYDSKEQFILENELDRRGLE